MQLGSAFRIAVERGICAGIERRVSAYDGRPQPRPPNGGSELRVGVRSVDDARDSPPDRVEPGSGDRGGDPNLRLRRLDLDWVDDRRDSVF
jgi:hypothetical protein